MTGHKGSTSNPEGNSDSEITNPATQPDAATSNPTSQSNTVSLPNPSKPLAFNITGHNFNGKNYVQWAQSVQIYIESRDKEDYLTGEKEEPPRSDPNY